MFWYCDICDSREDCRLMDICRDYEFMKEQEEEEDRKANQRSLEMIGMKNRYTCTTCKGQIITQDKHDGTTPFTLPCYVGKNEDCKGTMYSSCYRGVGPAEKVTHIWRRPTDQDYRKASPAMKQHFDQGGLEIYPNIVLTATTMEQHKKEFNEAMRTMDVQWAVAQGQPLRSAEISLHKSRYECSEMEPALRHESRAWLEARGYGRINDQPWPAPGVLPQ